MVEYINFGEKKYPVRISYKVLKQVSTLSEGNGEGGYGQAERLLYLSLQNGAKFEAIKFDLTEEQIEDMIDLHPEALGQFNEIMARQMGDLLGKLKVADGQMVG
jgi:hypothetical protein